MLEGVSLWISRPGRWRMTCLSGPVSEPTYGSAGAPAGTVSCAMVSPYRRATGLRRTPMPSHATSTV